MHGKALCWHDRVRSSGDYTLFVYECDITEGAESSDRRQRPRATVCSWLIRVDADNTARVLAWDTLANLTAPDNPSERPLGSAQTQAADTRAADIAEDERARRAERLANWARQIVSQLRRLPDQLSAGIADRALRLRRREEAAAAAAERVAATQPATVVARGEPRRVAWAHITGIAPADDAEDEDDPEERGRVDAVCDGSARRRRLGCHRRVQRRPRIRPARLGGLRSSAAWRSKAAKRQPPPRACRSPAAN